MKTSGKSELATGIARSMTQTAVPLPEVPFAVPHVARNRFITDRPDSMRI